MLHVQSRTAFFTEQDKALIPSICITSHLILKFSFLAKTIHYHIQDRLIPGPNNAANKGDACIDCIFFYFCDFFFVTKFRNKLLLCLFCPYCKYSSCFIIKLGIVLVQKLFLLEEMCYHSSVKLLQYTYGTISWRNFKDLQNMTSSKKFIFEPGGTVQNTGTNKVVSALDWLWAYVWHEAPPPSSDTVRCCWLAVTPVHLFFPRLSSFLNAALKSFAIIVKILKGKIFKLKCNILFVYLNNIQISQINEVL